MPPLPPQPEQPAPRSHASGPACVQSVLCAVAAPLGRMLAGRLVGLAHGGLAKSEESRIHAVTTRALGRADVLARSQSAKKS